MITKSTLEIFFKKILIIAEDNYDEFNSIDGQLGDGDLGITISKGLMEINNNFSTFLWISMLIAILGIVIEAIADLQLANFKANKSNAGKVMNRGLWYYSRHPNYFGDSLFWWGISIYCFTISGTILIFISPIIMTYLLLKVSGVTMLENRLSKKKDGYNEYIQTTSSFLILPKKKNQ